MHLKELNPVFLKSLSVGELEDYISNEIGSSDAKYFGCNYQGGLMLQQHPREYAEFLSLLKDMPAESYLELGIANGASFVINCLFTLAKHCTAVDNLSYVPHKVQFKADVIRCVEYLCQQDKQAEFVESNTDIFFQHNKAKFDIVFIDADHSYNGVKKDWENSLKVANNYIVFHDIANKHTGVYRLWNEIKNDYKYFEIIHSKNTGIGIIWI